GASGGAWSDALRLQLRAALRPARRAGGTGRGPTGRRVSRPVSSPPRRRLWALAAMSAMVACASKHAEVAPEPMPSCRAGETGLVRDVLYFGRNRPTGGEVADADWEAFLGAVVTPRFPDGLTIVEAHG